MTTADLVAFAERDWARVQRLKRARWIGRKRDLGPAEGIRLADQLHAQVREQRPDWPSADSRAADYRSHCRLAELLLVSARRR